MPSGKGEREDDLENCTLPFFGKLKAIKRLVRLLIITDIIACESVIKVAINGQW